MFILFAVFLHASHTWKKSGSLYMYQNAFGQSHCMNFKSTVYLEKIMRKPDFLHIDTDS